MKNTNMYNQNYEMFYGKLSTGTFEQQSGNEILFRQKFKFKF